jgi:hypothetical protein
MSMNPIPEADLLVLERLTRNPDFALYLTYLRRKKDSVRALYPDRIASEEDKALYNVQRGVEIGIDIAIMLPQDILRQEERDIHARTRSRRIPPGGQQPGSS